MHSGLNKILLFFIQATLFSICFPGFFCQNSEQYATCIEPFQCGRFRNLSYPFWGGSRPLSCGYPGFMLNCESAVPLLNISSSSYRVLEINFSTYTLKVAREDLWNNTCREVLYNTTLDTDLFEIPPDSHERNATLHFNCTDNLGQQNRLLNQFNCDVNGVTTMNIFSAGDAPSGPGTDITCSNKISVPVNQTAGQALETPSASSIHVLKAALANGFFIRWSADNANCEICKRSSGTCVYNRDSGKTACYKIKARMRVWAAPPAPVAHNESPDTPPAQIPGTPPHEGRGELSVPGLFDSLIFLPLLPASAPSAPGLSSPGSSGRAWIMIGATVDIIILAILKLCYLKRSCLPGIPNQVSKLDIEKILLQHGSPAPKIYKYSEIKKMTKSFNDKLGQGGYGSVYKGMLPDGCIVAVKVLIETNSNGEEFVNEVATISRTSHVNIVKLLGFCYDGNKRALVYEFMSNKSLDKFIRNSVGLRNIDFHLDFYSLYKIAVGVAKGLEYLHTGCNTRIVHFDIKPQNILLDEDFHPKISDFGLAKLCKKKQSVLSLLGARGTVGYIAPEVFSRNYGRVSHKSDVYSYGMMVLEMAGVNKIVETEAVQHSSENYFPDKIYELVTHDVTRKLDDSIIEEEQDLARKMFLVGFWCIQTTPSDRPSMSKVVEMLEGSLQSILIPPKPILFTPTLPCQEFSSSLSVYTETENSTEV